MYRTLLSGQMEFPCAFPWIPGWTTWHTMCTHAIPEPHAWTTLVLHMVHSSRLLQYELHLYCMWTHHVSCRSLQPELHLCCTWTHHVPFPNHSSLNYTCSAHGHTVWSSVMIIPELHALVLHVDTPCVQDDVIPESQVTTVMWVPGERGSGKLRIVDLRGVWKPHHAMLTHCANHEWRKLQSSTL